MSNERQAAADYVAALSAELAHIAYQNGLDSTGYMLEIAAAEACKASPGGGGPPPLDVRAAELVPEG